MKPTRTLKFLLVAIIFSAAFQSCSVYRSNSISIDEAVAFNRKVKLKTTSNETYKFKNLEKNEAGLVGITRPNSKAGRKMADEIFETNYRGKFVKISLEEESIAEIKQKDYLGSFFVVLGVTVAALAAFFAWIGSAVAFMP